MKRTIILPALVTAFLALSPVGVALADNPHNGPNNRHNHRSTEASMPDPTPSEPAGQPDGFANAEQHYAGSD